MSRLSGAVSAALLFMATFSGSAFGQSDARITAARSTLDLVMDLLSQSMFAIRFCAEGDMNGWYILISTIDRRQATCIGQDPAWIALNKGWEKEEVEARTLKLKDAGIGSFSYVRAMKEFPESVKGEAAIQRFCAAVPWKVLLKPNEATAQEQEKYAEPIRVMHTVRALAFERGWVDAPCDKSFWPPDFVLERRKN